MRPDIPEAQWSRLSRFIADTMGLHFPRSRRDDLRRGLAGAAMEFGFDEPAECADWLLSAPPAESRLRVLASHLTIGETYFFRDRRLMEAVAAHVLAGLIDARRGRGQRLRIWSAACCTGEEPYSLAILLHQLLPDLRDWDITITATDINARFLQRAAAGVYGEWSFRDTPPGFRERYFTPTEDGRHAVRPEIRKLVKFAHLNLAADTYPSPATATHAMDLIFCRNVLMYFKPSRIDAVIGRLHRALADGGWLVTGPSEACDAIYSRFATHSFPGAILYRRSDAGHRHEQPSGGAVAPARLPVRTVAPHPPPGGTDRFGVLPLEDVAEPTPSPASPHVRKPRLARAGAAARTVETNSPSHRTAAESLYHAGRYREAADTLLAGAGGHPCEPAALSILTRALANLGRLDEALASCERWISADKLDATACYLQGVILLEQGDHEHAQGALRRALYLEPDFVLAHYTLGNLAREDGRSDDARRHFANALRALQGCDPDAPVSESDGLTARRLAETIGAMTGAEAHHGR